MRNTFAGTSRTRLLASWFTVTSSVLLIAACAGGRPAAVSPEEIPALEDQLASDPTNADVMLRYSAALFADGQCDSATAVARNGMARKPKDALGPLVVGSCYEQQRDWDQALGVYRTFLATYPQEKGASVVRARQTLAQRERATDRARLAIQSEADFAQQAGDPQTLAVLPLDIVGDSMYQPLSRGLAQIITSDLALLQRFRMVERLQVGALLDEMELGQSGRVDAATAARVGRLLQAGRMVQGLAAIPGQEQTRLEATVVLSDGEVTAPAVESGEFKNLLEMEKRLVVSIAEQLGYQLSQAELNLILENGTQNLAAFLAYSRGLVAEDLGDYSAAAMHYGDAARADPSFQQAQDQYQATAAAPAAEQATVAQITTVATEPPPPAVEPTVAPIAVVSTVSDVAAIQSEVTLGTSVITSGDQGGSTDAGGGVSTPIAPTGTGTNASQPPPTPTIEGTPVTGTGTSRIFFRLP
jgi:tetratricopeptide (TPR) repeat protein